jgi:hypothetical protein
MPTHEQDQSFWRDWRWLNRQQRRAFRKAAAALNDDLAAGSGIRASLRAHPMKNHPGIWGLTWQGNDGRATFRFGPEHTTGTSHVVWRRVGGHEIFENP